MSKQETIQDRLKKIMQDNGVSSRQMAISAGIDPSYFGKALKGVVGLTLEKIEAISKVYNVDIDWLRDGSADNNPNKITGKTTHDNDLQSLIYSNRLLAEAQKGLSDAHLILARVIETTTVDVGQRTFPTDESTIQKVLEVVASLGVPKLWQTVEEGVGTLHTILRAESLKKKKMYNAADAGR